MNPIALRIALANTHGIVNRDDVFNYIESESEDIESYELAPPPPGTVMCAGVDYALILGSVGSVASIASLLWYAYDKFIGSRVDKNKSAGLYVMLQTDDDWHVEFMIGDSHRTEEVFVRDFTKTIEILRESTEDGKTTDRLIAQLRDRQMWVRRK